MKAKLVEIARGMMDTGNFRLLPEFQRKYDESYGEDLLRRIGSTPSYDQIISKYKEDRDLGRHAGAGSRKYDDELFGEQETNIDDNVELEGQEINIEEIAFDINDIEDLNTSIELEEVASTFDQDMSEEQPSEVEPENGGAIAGIEPTCVSSTERETDSVEKEARADTIPSETVAFSSLVPEYELTPSPLSSAGPFPSRCSSSSPMLRLTPTPTPSLNSQEQFSPSSPVLRSPAPLEMLTPMPPLQRATSIISSYERPPIEETEAPQPSLVPKPVAVGVNAVTPLVLDPVYPATPSSVRSLVEDDLYETPSSRRAIDLDVISYVPEMDTYLSPGRLFPISVQLKKNICSQCGVRRPRNWCAHLRNAARKAGMEVPNTPIYLKSLTQLRKNQRADKSKSGRKAPRRFDLIQIHELNNQDESQEIELEVAKSMPLFPRSTVDDVIDSVVSQAYATEAVDDVIDMVASPTDAEEVIASSSDKNVEDTEKLRCVCSKPSESQMIACVNLECKVEWFHFKCVNIRKAPRGEWICIQCRSSVSTKRKLTFGKESDSKKQKTVKKEKCPKCDHLLATSYLKLHIKKYCAGFKV